MIHNVGILAPGKGWGNFVSYISCFKTISKERNKKIIFELIEPRKRETVKKSYADNFLK